MIRPCSWVLNSMVQFLPFEVHRTFGVYAPFFPACARKKARINNYDNFLSAQVNYVAPTTVDQFLNQITYQICSKTVLWKNSYSKLSRFSAVEFLSHSDNMQDKWDSAFQNLALISIDNYNNRIIMHGYLVRNGNAQNIERKSSTWLYQELLEWWRGEQQNNVVFLICFNKFRDSSRQCFFRRGLHWI